MKHRNPPRIATWLLHRLSACDEALMGDLLEEYCRGRSRYWYWRQALIAVVRSTDGDILSHPVLALRAFALMMVCVLCYEYCLVRPFDILFSDLIWKLNPRLLVPEHPTVFTFGYFFLVLEVLAPCIGYAIGARIVARFHRTHQTAFTLFNATLVLLVNAIELLWFVAHNPRHQRFSSKLFYFVPLFLLFVLSTVVGGLWKLKSPESAQA